MALTRRLVAAPLVLALAAAPAAALAAGGGAKKHHKRHRTYTADVRDYYFAPTKLRIHVGDKVKWEWPTTTGDSHDVALDRGPKGVKPFESEIASTTYPYTVRFRKPGRYHIVCTLHSQMRMKVIVRR
jgi:plastocyanin